MPVSSRKRESDRFAWGQQQGSTLFGVIGEFAHLTGDSGTIHQWLKTDGFITAVASKTADYTLTSEDHTVFVDTSNGNVTIDLPVSPTTGQVYYVKRISTSNAGTLGRNGKAIDGENEDYLLLPNATVAVQYDGTGWRTLAVMPDSNEMMEELLEKLLIEIKKLNLQLQFMTEIDVTDEDVEV